MPILSALRANLLACILGLAAAVFMVMAVVQSIELNGFLWIDGVKDKLERVTIDNNELRAAAKEAERLNEKQVERITNDQDRISDERLADLTARLERLRSELRAKATKGNSERPQASPDGKPSEGTDGPPALCLTSEELLRAAEDEERHDQLITWVEQQLKVDRQ